MVTEHKVPTSPAIKTANGRDSYLVRSPPILATHRSKIQLNFNIPSSVSFIFVTVFTYIPTYIRYTHLCFFVDLFLSIYIYDCLTICLIIYNIFMSVYRSLFFVWLRNYFTAYPFIYLYTPYVHSVIVFSITFSILFSLRFWTVSSKS
jgi:hypothetical protein